MPQYYTRQGFQDPRKPKENVIDMIRGAARQQFPLFGERDALTKYSSPPAQENAGRTAPVEAAPPPPSEQPMYEDYEQTLGTPAPTQQPQPKWKQALGYAAAAFRPTRGTDLPERLIVGDDNLRANRAREAEMARTKELGSIEEKRHKAGIEGRETTVKERSAGVAERGATTDEGQLQFDRDKFPVEMQRDILKAGGYPEGGKVAMPTGREGEESTYTFQKPTTAIPPRYREQAGGLEELPNAAIPSYLSGVNQQEQLPFSSAGRSIYDRRSGQITGTAPDAQQRSFAVDPGQQLFNPETNKFTTAPGTPSDPRTAAKAEAITRKFNDRMMAATNSINSLAARFKVDPDMAEMLQEQFNAQKQQAVQAYASEWSAAFGTEPPSPPDYTAPIGVGEEPGMLWGTNKTVTYGGGQPGVGAPTGPTSPANMPPIGPTVPDGPPPPQSAPPPSPQVDAQISQFLLSQGVPQDRLQEALAAVKSNPQAMQEALSAIQGR